MPSLREIEELVLRDGKVDGQDLEALRQQVYGNGKISRQKADFLVELHKRVQRRTPAFEQFFYRAIKDHILAEGNIGREATDWLRQLLFTDGKILDEERKFLHELKGEAKQTSPEFEKLFAQAM